MPGQTRLALIRTCDDVSIAILHPVLIFLGRVPWCSLSLKEALRKGGKGGGGAGKRKRGTRRGQGEEAYVRSLVSALYKVTGAERAQCLYIKKKGARGKDK